MNKECDGCGKEPVIETAHYGDLCMSCAKGLLDTLDADIESTTDDLRDAEDKVEELEEELRDLNNNKVELEELMNQ